MTSLNNKKKSTIWTIWIRLLKAFVLLCLIGACVIPGISVDPDFDILHSGGQIIAEDPGPEPLKIGYSRYPYPPLHDYDTDGGLIGFDIGLALAAAEIMDERFAFIPINWANRASLLVSGEVDILWGGLEANSLDEQAIQFTSPYLQSDIVLLMDYDRDYSKFEDLEGLSVCVLNHTPAFDYLQTYRNSTIKNRESFFPAQYADLFHSLASGDTDCMITDINFAAFFRAATGRDYKISDTIIPSSYAVAVRADDTELLRRLQDALDKLAADGEVDLLKDKWVYKIKIEEYGHTSGNAF